MLDELKATLLTLFRGEALVELVLNSIVVFLILLALKLVITQIIRPFNSVPGQGKEAKRLYREILVTQHKIAEARATLNSEINPQS